MYSTSFLRRPTFKASGRSVSPRMGVIALCWSRSGRRKLNPEKAKRTQSGFGVSGMPRKATKIKPKMQTKTRIKRI
jgi:hypothetical protein